ncbi:hypothetical protein [Geodermatophilus sp. URMC 65]
MLTDPREALTEQNSLVHCLLGLVGLARLVRALAADDCRRDTIGEADDFIYLLLALARLGDAVECLPQVGVADAPHAQSASSPPSSPRPIEWLR